ncbi:MAG TPA: M13-type metalloendopeptidase, partial [Tahibacter sp.]|nr:M13-type metalloendopeptidase [Tahibacter sp.]
FKLAQSRDNKDQNGKIDGLSPDQRFFINFAQVWRRTFRPEELKRRLNVDPHAPIARNCAGDAMVRAGDKLVKIW